MGKYDKFKRLVIPLSIAKNTITTALPGMTGRVTVASPGNEGIDVAEWFQERLDDGTIIIDNSSLITLTGLPGGSTDLGIFTGSIISDNTTIVNAFQELETYIESLGVSGDGIYGGNGNIADNTVATALGNFYINSNVAGKRIVLGNDSSGYHLTLFNSSGIILRGASSNGFYVDNTSTQLSHSTTDYIKFSGDGNSELKSSYTSFKINAATPGTFQGLVYAFDPSTNFIDESLVTKRYVDSVASTVYVDSGLIGDGSIGNPLDWAGASVSAPITGSGSSFFPLTIANNSITTAHIQTGTILFSDWNQNSATSGQVPQWNGTNWIASSITGTLPSGSLGSMLIHNGSNYISITPLTETQSGITGSSLTLASTPISYAPINLYRNGIYQVVTDDFTVSGMNVTFVTALVSTDKITVIYYI